MHKGVHRVPSLANGKDRVLLLLPTGYAEFNDVKQAHSSGMESSETAGVMTLPRTYRRSSHPDVLEVPRARAPVLLHEAVVRIRGVRTQILQREHAAFFIPFSHFCLLTCGMIITRAKEVR